MRSQFMNMFFRQTESLSCDSDSISAEFWRHVAAIR